MCPESLVKKITKNTKAVIAVHMLGVPCKIDKIRDICKKKNITLLKIQRGDVVQNLKINIWVHGAILAHSLLILVKQLLREKGACYF